YWTLHAVLVKRHEDDPVFDTAFRLFWRRRDPNEAILSEMLPLAPAAAIKRTGERRVQEALQETGVRALPRARAKEDLTYDMRGTASDLEVLASKDFAQMSAAEIAEARRRISLLAFTYEEIPSRRAIADPRGHRIDLRRTLRASLRAGGDLIDLKRRARGRPHPPLLAPAPLS